MYYTEGTHQRFFCVKKADLICPARVDSRLSFFPPKTDEGEEKLFSVGQIAGIKGLTSAVRVVRCGAGGSVREIPEIATERILSANLLPVCALNKCTRDSKVMATR